MPDQASEPLVSVIVPAFNAEGTLQETLASIACQTYHKLEVLVVDDGSTDSTATLAEHFCHSDRRFRLIRQPNSGVALARNAGIREAAGEFIAPIDADDLWHPEKIARQVACLQDGSSRVGLVYNWSRIIDEQSRVAAVSASARLSGNVLREHLRWNFIGNGSTPMFRASVFEKLSYEPLRVSGDQGCEDFLLQLQVASRFEFACVPAFLTGYRERPATMSGNLSRMIELHLAMYERLLDWLAPEFRRDVEQQIGRQRAAFAVVSAAQRRYRGAIRSMVQALRQSPVEAVREVLARTFRADRQSTPVLGRPFAELGPEEGAVASRVV